MKKFIIFIAAALAAVSVFTACGKTTDSSSSSGEASASVSSDITEKEMSEAVLYIGNNGNFKEYPIEYEGEITPEVLIEQIAVLTGWNLDLADSVTTGKGGMTVCFAKTSAIFTGPPEEQKDEFLVYDTEELCSTIFDSIKHTLQYNFVDSKIGDPESLDIFYCTENNEPIYIEPLGITIPVDEPYKGFEYFIPPENKGNGTVSTAECEFQGLADGHSVEVITGGEVDVLQFYVKKIFLPGITAQMMKQKRRQLSK